jgi:hypothetical protein
MVVGSDAIKGLAEYHFQRGIQLETTYSSFLVIANKLAEVDVWQVYNFGSWNLAGEPAEALARFSGYFMIILLLAAYWFIYRNTKSGKSQTTRLGAYALLVMGIVLITSKILSPQYLIWLIPVVPLVWQRTRYAVLLVFILIGVITYYLFPHAYLDLIRLQTIPVIFLFIRNLLLILLTILAVVALRGMKSSE